MILPPTNTLTPRPVELIQVGFRDTVSVVVRAVENFHDELQDVILFLLVLLDLVLDDLWHCHEIARLVVFHPHLATLNRPGQDCRQYFWLSQLDLEHWVALFFWDDPINRNDNQATP